MQRVHDGTVHHVRGSDGAQRQIHGAASREPHEDRLCDLEYRSNRTLLACAVLAEGLGLKKLHGAVSYDTLLAPID